jgi:hypothetical protein
MKVSDFDAWLDEFEMTLNEAAANVRKIRIEKSPICTGCYHNFRTYASPPCNECEPTGTKYQASEDKER